MSTKRKKKDRVSPEELVFSKPEDRLEGPHVRRLFEVTYQCHLCQQIHMGETYLTVESDNLDDLNAEFKEMLEDEAERTKMIMGMSHVIHSRHGDLQAVNRRFRENPDAVYRIFSWAMTPESEYTCDDCGREFENIGTLRLHMGINHLTGIRTPGSGGLSECVRSDGQAPAFRMSGPGSEGMGQVPGPKLSLI